MAFSIISCKEPFLNGEISLPASKSISNRLLMIRALSGTDMHIEHLSDADDTLLLADLLARYSSISLLDCRNAGTALRFLTAYCSIQPGEHLLTGSERMKQRPVGILVEALRSLGASIDYDGCPGYPPLRITGKNLRGGDVTVDASVSSQYVSALLLIAPYLSGGLTITITGKQVSSPYVDMTIGMMEKFGVTVQRNGSALCVAPGVYRQEKPSAEGFGVEADWSSAAFWYEAAALSESAEIAIPGLYRESLQGDAIVTELFQPLGVKTLFQEDGILLIKEKGSGQWAVGRGQLAVGKGQSVVDLSDFPDLAPALIVSYAVLGIPTRFTGLEHLAIKESNRLQALVTESGKLHLEIRHPASGTIETTRNGLRPTDPAETGPVIIETYGDHRIAMAFAMVAAKSGKIWISNPGVVAKSYPGFWEEMEEVGFEVGKT